MEEFGNTKDEGGVGRCMKITSPCYQVSIRPPDFVLSDRLTLRCWLIIIMLM